MIKNLIQAQTYEVGKNKQNFLCAYAIIGWEP